MKTSASNATSTSFRRRSLKVAADVPEELPQNDDEAERQQRRRDSGKFTHLAEKRLSVGAGGSASGSGTSFVEFSASELVAQYENCIKLSFANKINHKNAFSLPLIDCMKALLKKKDAHMNNFQFVSCTLDASAKIYASRVDRVHMDGLNFAQNLGAQPRSAVARVEDDNSDVEAQGEDNPKAGKTKKKYKKRRRNQEDTSKITLALKQQVEQDATYTYMRKQFGNCQPGFTSFVPRLAVKGDGCRVLLDLKEPLLSPAATPAAREDESVDVSVDPNADLSSKFLCPTYRDILNCEADDIDYDALLQPSQNLDDTLDNDLDTAEPVDYGAGGDDLPCDAVDEDMTIERGFNETMATSTESGPVAAACRPAGDMKEHLVDVQPLNSVTLAVQNVVDGSLEGMTVDYSTQHLERLLWAGPAHWRQLPLCKARTAQQAQAETARRKDRRSSAIDFSGVLLLKDIEMVSSKRTTISAAFMKQNWSVQKVTNPTDLHLDFKVLIRLFLRPEVEVFKFGSPMVMEKKAGTLADEDGDDDVCQYDYNNINDSQCFCPDVNQESIDGSEEPDGGPAETNEDGAEDVHALDLQISEGANWQLVEPPQKVARIVMNYAQHAKKVDMKKLKRIIWKTLVREGEAEATGSNNRQAAAEGADKPSDDPTTEEVTMMKGSVAFSRMLQVVLERAPRDMAPDLTMSLVFTALLHLANEKVLILESNEDYSDIIISQHQSAAPIVHRHDKRQYK